MSEMEREDYDRVIRFLEGAREGRGVYWEDRDMDIPREPFQPEGWDLQVLSAAIERGELYLKPGKRAGA